MNIILALLAILPAEPFEVISTDICEVNTVLDQDGQRRFTQVLWVDCGGPNEIRGWAFFYQYHLPVGGVSMFEHKGQLRAVKFTSRRVLVSETYHDPEVERRKIQPIVWRRGFSE